MDLQPFPDDWQRALCVVAHPDDLEYGTSIAVARWTAEGRSVTYLLATSGEAGIDTLPPERCGPLREQEEVRAAAEVGVATVDFLGYRDGTVTYDLALRRDVAACIRRLRPDVVVTGHFGLTWGPGPGGPANQADHRAVGLATLDAARDAGNRWIFPEVGEPYSPRWVAVHGTPTPSHFVAVSEEHLAAGVASLRAHQLYFQSLGQAFEPDQFLRSQVLGKGPSGEGSLAVAFELYQL